MSRPIRRARPLAAAGDKDHWQSCADAQPRTVVRQAVRRDVEHPHRVGGPREQSPTSPTDTPAPQNHPREARTAQGAQRRRSHDVRPLRAGARPGHRGGTGRAPCQQGGGDVQQEPADRRRCRPARTACASRTVNRGRPGEASHGPLRGRRPGICYGHPAAPATRKRYGERYARRRRACGRSSRR